MKIFKDDKYWREKYKKLYHQQEKDFVRLHNAIRRYEQRARISDLIEHDCKSAIANAEAKAEKYKQLYADELQKRLELAEKVREMEGNANGQRD